MWPVSTLFHISCNVGRVDKCQLALRSKLEMIYKLKHHIQMISVGNTIDIYVIMCWLQKNIPQTKVVSIIA